MKAQLLYIAMVLQQVTAALLQTYTVSTRLRAEREQQLTCSDDLSNRSSQLFINLNTDMSEALEQVMLPKKEVDLISCYIVKISCEDGFPLVNTRVEISSDQSVSANQLHQVLQGLITETIITIDSLQVQDFNECETGNHTCHSRASCMNTMGSYVCTCKQGYKDLTPSDLPSGRLCQASCGDSSCANDGVCITQDDKPVCRCMEKYTGQTCSILKQDVEWLWIVAIVLVVATLLLVPSGVFLCIYLSRRRRTSASADFKFLTLD